MSASKDTAVKELGADGDKKGRFMVRFAAGRQDNEDPESATHAAIQKFPSPKGKWRTILLHITWLHWPAHVAEWSVRDALSFRGSRLSPSANAYQRIISNNSYAHNEQGESRTGKTVRRYPL